MKRAFLILASFFCVRLVCGQVLEQVRDLETDGAYPLNLLVVGDKLYYLSATKTEGERLWVTDGTASGTRPVPFPGPTGPIITRAVEGIVYGNPRDGNFWRTDGTNAGTFKIFDGNGAYTDYYTSAYALGKVGTRLIFNAHRQIWALDDAGGAPELLADTEASMYAPPVIGADGRLYFAGGNSAFANYLWSTDGTRAGTQNLGGFPGGFRDLARVGRYIFLKGGIFQDAHPYRYDATAGGITEFTDPETGRRLSNISFVKGGDRLFIVDQTYGEPVRIYATSDGESLQLVTTSGPHNYPPAIQWLGDALYYNRYAGNVLEVWKSDGTPGGTMKLPNVTPVPLIVRPHDESNLSSDIIRWGDYIYYFAVTEQHGWAMWRIHADGGPAERVADLPDDRTGAAPRELVLFGGALYFSAHDGREGRKLWRSDGTTQGTGLADDAFAGSYTSYPEGLKVLNDGYAYFLTRTQDLYYMTVWRSDGTRDGTTPIITGFVSPPNSSGNNLPEKNLTLLFEHKGILYMTGNDGVHGHELWRTDGTQEGTFLVKDIYTRFGGIYDPHPLGFTLLNDEVFFADEDDLGSDIWKTDGTTAGTVRVSNFHGSYLIHSIRRAGQLLYFVSGTRETGAELYRSDGTDAGTYMLKDIVPGEDSSNVIMLAELNGKLLFSTNSSRAPETLWITDGTREGTAPVKANPAEQPRDLDWSVMVFKNKLYFSAEDPVRGKEIWVSDGTDAGTHLFQELRPGQEGSDPWFYAVMDGALYFYANGGNGADGLWKTFGTPEGTSFVAPVKAEFNGGIVGGVAGGLLYFNVPGPNGSSELWRTDGTPADTFLLKLNPLGESYPFDFAAFGDRMLFFAYDGFTGDELWSAKPDPTQPPPRLANISTRGYVGSGDGSLIGGFIVTGDTPQRIAVRALGPSLHDILPGALGDPELTLFNANGATVASNGDWRKGDAGSLTAAGLPLAHDLESGIVATLQPGAYTARVTGAGGTTGVGLVEIYNLNDAAASSRLANISTRADVRGGDEILIGGFIVQGNKPRRLVIRALGESLAVNGIPVPNRLADATLELFDGNGALLAKNDNWRDAQGPEIEGAHLAPGSDSDAALLIALPAGAYTAQVRGKNNGSGIALVEIYAVE